jgi:hypothetical protein
LKKFSELEKDITNLDDDNKTDINNFQDQNFNELIAAGYNYAV